MLTITTAGTWGITGAQFLWGYGTLCAATAIGVWQAYRQALGPPAGPMDPPPRLGVGQIGVLSGGPDCAITAAAARLYYDGLLRGTSGTLSATGELNPAAEPIEREVYEAVRRDPWLSVDQMRTRVRESAAMQALSEQLRRAGLLLGQAQARRVRLLWIVPALVTAFGVLRILTGLAEGRPILVLCVMTAIAGLATAWLVALRPAATQRGQDVLERLRGERGSLVHDTSNANQIALTAALFGVGTLWLAESAIASALGVPREEDPTVGGNGGGSGGGCGGGGDGGGGGCGGCGGCG